MIAHKIKYYLLPNVPIFTDSVGNDTCIYSNLVNILL